MDIAPQSSSPAGTADLTKVAPFSLGAIAVDPPARVIAAGERSDRLEPRVMRVLVALGRKPGRVLSRDDLIELCWDGTIVGENAIKRVIFRLRHALDELSGGAVRLETITKVGFRLVVDAPQGAGEVSGALHADDAEPMAAAQAEATPAPRRIWTRRAVWTGLAAGAAGTASFAWLQSRAGHVPDPRAVELCKRAQQIQKDGAGESMGEAIKAYKQAVAIDPHHADAWGSLALSYRYPLYGPDVQWGGDPQEIRAAARRALALDPGNADARLALILIYPNYRRWVQREAQLRAFLRDHPDSALGHVCRGWLLLEVGRIEDAVTAAEQAMVIDPLKTVWSFRAMAYYLAGREGAGDVNIEELRSRWPQDSFIYYVGYYWLLCGRRFEEARAYAADTGRRPRTIRPEMAEFSARKADALATGRGIAEFQNRSLPAAMQMQSPEFSVIDMALLGKVDELFALFEASFLGGEFMRTRFPPPGPLDVRYCFGLFFPVLGDLRGDPRYASLLQRTGLEDYWRKSRTLPDFRRH